MKDKEVSVAPMMDWTDRHCRFLHRLLSPSAVLYTEMVTAAAILHGNKERLLGFNKQEHPVILQLGGSEPDDLGEAAAIGTDFGYDGINLNCGCPSERVQKGAFGACLMAEPDLVAACVDGMKKRTKLPVTVKCRIGIDDHDAREMLFKFIKTVAAAGCDTFVVHARKAWLKGLSPKENREVPPLDYALVRDLKRDTDLTIILNGGVATATDTLTHMDNFDGVMLGRAAYHTPEILQELHQTIHGEAPVPLPEIVEAMIQYADDQKARYGTPTHSVTRHMIGMHSGKRGARAWRRILTVDSLKADNARDVLIPALAAISEGSEPVA